jgi:hypothetical protein
MPLLARTRVRLLSLARMEASFLSHIQGSKTDMPPKRDYTGLVYGRLTALRDTGAYHTTQSGNKKKIWEFQCACGNICQKMIEKVTHGWVKSCGCLRSTRTQLQGLQHSIYGDYADGDLIEEDFVWLSQQPCQWCGKWRPSTRTHRFNKEVSWDYHGLDRLDNNLPHHRDNVVPCCWICNEFRGNKSVPEFLELIQDIHLHSIDR